jgi:hypothetical protein
MVEEPGAAADPVWTRLRGNCEKNSHAFLKAGLRDHAFQEIECPSCQGRESPLFWTLVELKRGVLHLRCPFCDREKVEYSISSWLPPRARDVVLGVLVVLMTAGTILIVVATAGGIQVSPRSQVRAIAADARLELTRMLRATAARPISGPTSPVAEAVPRSPGARRAAINSPASAGERQASTRPGGASAAAPPPVPTRRSAPAETQPQRSAPPGSDSPGSAVAVFLAAGDRRQEIRMRAADIRATAGEQEAGMLVEVEYDPVRDETRVVVNARSAEWLGSFSRSRGWQPIAR